MSEEARYPTPSNGSLICTFADCPDRAEDLRDRKFGEIKMLTLCPDGNPLAPRCTDYSTCHHGGHKEGYVGRGCRVGRGGMPVLSNAPWCEVFLCDGICPRGFRR